MLMLMLLVSEGREAASPGGLLQLHEADAHAH